MGGDIELNDVFNAINDIQGNENLRLAVSQATANEDSVKTRLEVATKRFAAI